MRYDDSDDWERTGVSVCLFRRTLLQNHDYNITLVLCIPGFLN
jgi:hypothetical protein